MISLERIDKAIKKCEDYIKDIPPDEIVPENISYMKWEMLLKGLRGYRDSFIKIDALLTELKV